VVASIDSRPTVLRHRAVALRPQNPIPAPGPRCDGGTGRVTLGSRRARVLRTRRARKSYNQLRSRRRSTSRILWPSRAVRRPLSVASIGILGRSTTTLSISCVWDGGNALRVGAIIEERKNAAKARRAATALPLARTINVCLRECRSRVFSAPIERACRRPMHKLKRARGKRRVEQRRVLPSAP
jgi:hypothetical protein